MTRKHGHLAVGLGIGVAILTCGEAPAEEAGARAELERKLESSASFQFLETPVGAALDYLAQKADLTIVRSPNADDDTPVTFRGREMPVRRALRWITYLAGLDYAVHEDGVFVAPRSEIVESRATSATFDVRDLVAIGARDFPGPDLVAAATGTPTFEFDSAGDFGIAPDSLLELVRGMVEPGSWDDPPMAIDHERGVLFATHTPDAILGISRLLDELRKNSTRLVAMEGVLYAVPVAVWRELLVDPATGLPRTILGGEEWIRIERALGARADCRVEERLATTCHSGQRVHVVGGSTRAYVADVDTTVAQGAGAADAIVGHLRVGGVLDVRPIASGDGERVKLTIRPQHVASLGGSKTTYGPADSRPELAGPIEIDLPETWTVAARTSAVIPDGGAVVLTFGADLAGKPVGTVDVQFIHARVVALEE